MIASTLPVLHSVQVVPLVVALFALSGCDLVLSLDTVNPVTLACGPFGPATPVTYSQRLLDGNAHDLSIDDTGTTGAVYVTLGGVAKMTMLKNTAGTWDVDPIPMRNIGLSDRQGHVNANGELNVTVVSSPSGIFHYIYFGAQWAQDASPGSSVLDVDPSFDLFPGNEIDVFDTTANQVVYKRAVLVKHPKSGATKNILMVVNRMAPFDNAHLWAEDKTKLQPLNNVSTLLPSQGVLTADLKKLVYAAKSGASTTSDIFVSAVGTESTFDAGQLLDTVSTSDHDEDEPWINSDCSTIWFRRDGVTMMAQKQ